MENEIRRLLESPQWKLLILLAVVLTLIMLVAEIFVKLNPQQLEIEEVSDLALLLIFGTDVFMRYHLAKDKREFLKKNWLDILVVLPFSRIMRALKVAAEVADGALRIFKASSFAYHSNYLIKSRKKKNEESAGKGSKPTKRLKKSI